MRRAIIILTTILFYKIYGQTDNNLTGTWIAEKIKINDKEFVSNLDADTLRFANDNFEQRIILMNDRREKFLWTQGGKYILTRRKLVLKNRTSSHGQSGKEYPEISHKYKVQNGNLILIDAKPNGTLLTYYKRISVSN